MAVPIQQRNVPFFDLQVAQTGNGVYLRKIAETMTLINANDLFDITSFQEDTDTLEYPKIYYICQDGHEIAFSMKHFKKHALSKATNLTAEDAQAMDDFMADKDLGRSNSFLDFYSPNGEEAVRIYFLAWAGGRFTAGYDITFVLKMFKKTQVV